MSKPKAMVLLVSGSFTSADLLLPLDRLRLREESTYVMLDDPKLADPQSGCEHLNIGQARVTTAASVLSSDDYGGYDLLFIPNASNMTTLNMEFVARVIQTIYSENMTVIATGTGRLLLAASGLLKDRVASSKSLDLDEQYIGSARAWDSETEMICDVVFWTATNDVETLNKLSVMYKASHLYPVGGIFPSSIWNKYFSHKNSGAPEIPDTVKYNPPAMSSGEDVALELAELSSANAREVAGLVFHFAVRLGIEGFSRACNSLLLALFSMFPNAIECLGDPCLRPIEFLWESLGERPNVPWDPPSRDEIDNWDREVRANHQFPPPEDREDVLESIVIRTLDNDWILTPYTLPGAITMAIDAGWNSQARHWMSKLVRDTARSGFTEFWTFCIAKWRPLVALAITGVVAEVTGRTAEQADRDAEVVKQTLRSIRPAVAATRDQRRASVGRFTEATWSVLVPKLDILKWDQHDTLLKPPASPSAIEEAEERLGATLPEDYKQFLLVSNGMEFMPSINAPGFKPVEDLEWQTAEELGLDNFRVDLGCETDPAEYERLPKMARVLVLSDDSEEQVWYVDPETTAEAIRVLKAEGRGDDVVGQPGWRAIFWVNYLPDLKWLTSFRGYIESLARKADKAGSTK